MHVGRVRGGWEVGVGRATFFFFFSLVGKLGVPRSTSPPLFLAWQFRQSRYPLDERDMVTARRPFGAGAVGPGNATHTLERETTNSLVFSTRPQQKSAAPHLLYHHQHFVVVKRIMLRCDFLMRHFS